jgi:hypothetical protein
MPDKTKVIVDPHFRRMSEIFSPADLVWGKDEPMPIDTFAAALPEAVAVVCSDWRYGNERLRDARNLRAILDVSGAFSPGCQGQTQRHLRAQGRFGNGRAVGNGANGGRRS